VAGEIAKESGGMFRLVEEDPDRPGVEWNRRRLEETYGFRPIPVSFLSDASFYFHLVLAVGDDLQRIFPGADMTEVELRTEIEAALKRGASGFLKTVGLWTPPPAPPPAQPGMRPPVRPSFEMLRERLGENYNVRAVELSAGRVEGDIDVLAVLAPQELSERERFAVDQYLMRGGAVVVATGRYMLDPASLQGGGLSVKKVEGGLDPLLAHYGITLDDALVMDERNEPFPVPVVRRVGMFQVREIQQVNYPYFIDVRPDTMAKEHPVVSNLPAVTLNWASPLSLDEATGGERQVRVLLRSGPASWSVSAPDSVQPDFNRYPERGFAGAKGYDPSILAVSVQGVFDSYFRDREIPGAGEAGEGESGADTSDDPLVGRIDRSPDSSRLVLVSSGEFVNDLVLGISRSGGQDRFMNSLEFLQNAVDWSVEDEALLRIRSRGSQARLLEPVSKERQATLEGMNYGVALIALIVLSVTGVLSRRREKPMTLIRPAGAEEGR